MNHIALTLQQPMLPSSGNYRGRILLHQKYDSISGAYYGKGYSMLVLELVTSPYRVSILGSVRGNAGDNNLGWCDAIRSGDLKRAWIACV